LGAGGGSAWLGPLPEGEGVLRFLPKLLTWLSPAFPVGGFAYSHGLEWAVEAGDVLDEDTLRDWIEDVLRHGSGRSDAILLRHAYRADSRVELAAIAELGEAVQPCRERRAETLGQGEAFVIATRVWGASMLEGALPYPVAFGAFARAQSVPEDPATLGFLHAFAANLISAAVRLVPLGQTAGLRTLASLEPTVMEVAAGSARAGLDEIGGACLRSDIAAMRHETQHTRLFRT
jgi:urease accessory protein